MEEHGEIILYQPNDEVRLEVRLEDDTVWLTQAQMAELFMTTKQNVSLHVNNIFKEKELENVSVVKESLTTANDGKKYRTKYYNLDVIISVGYRVKSIRGTQFRQWANKVLKEYLLKGYTVNQRLNAIEYSVNQRVSALEQTVAEHSKKIDFFIHTSLPPVEGVFFNGQIFDAYKFVTDIIQLAKKSIVLIDNYIDESVLLMLGKRHNGVTADIYTQNVSQKLKVDLAKYNSQYEHVSVHTYKHSHDRFLIIDGSDVYHIGASLKDLGKRMFAFSKLEIPATTITDLL